MLTHRLSYSPEQNLEFRYPVVLNAGTTISRIFNNYKWGFTTIHLNFIIISALSGTSSTGTVNVKVFGHNDPFSSNTTAIPLTTSQFACVADSTLYNYYMTINTVPPYWSVEFDNNSGGNIIFNTTGWVGSKQIVVDEANFYCTPVGSLVATGAT